MNLEQIVNSENIHRKIKQEIFDQEHKDLLDISKDNWIKVDNSITQISEQFDPNFKLKIETEIELEQKLNEKGYTKYIGLNYNRSDLEKQFPFFKNFWYRNVSYYSYSIKAINNYFGRTILEDNTPMTAYVINYLIFLYNKEKYWSNYE